MAIIEGAASGALADVVSTNKGLRVSLCDTQGAIHNRPLFGCKLYHIRITTAIGAGGVLWSIRNLSATKSLYIVGGGISLSLDTVTTVEVGLEIVRFTGATFTTGTQLTPFVLDTSQTASVGPDIRFSSATAGLTTTGATIDATTQALCNISIPFNAGSVGRIDFGTALWGLRLQNGEGICLRTNPTAAPIGLTVGGMIVWGEE